MAEKNNIKTIGLIRQVIGLTGMILAAAATIAVILTVFFVIK